VAASTDLPMSGGSGVGASIGFERSRRTNVLRISGSKTRSSTWSFGSTFGQEASFSMDYDPSNDED